MGLRWGPTDAVSTYFCVPIVAQTLQYMWLAQTCRQIYPYVFPAPSTAGISGILTEDVWHRYSSKTSGDPLRQAVPAWAPTQPGASPRTKLVSETGGRCSSLYSSGECQGIYAAREEGWGLAMPHTE